MINIKFPNGDVKKYPQGIDGLQIAKDISKSLEKKSIALKINGKAYDILTKIESDASIEIITTDSKEGLEILRHDTAHIMAQAVKRLYPDCKIAIGPAIEDGFYYDFKVQKPFTEEDLVKIEAEMKKIIQQNIPFIKKTMSKKEAVDFFKAQHEDYKVQIIEKIPSDEEVTLYTQGEFIDLCRGPHSISTGQIKAFKLLRVAGAYWLGDSKNEMLQRIYGTAWANEQDLTNYLNYLEEAKKRDHRKLGKEMDLFHFQEEAPGAVFWHPKGWQIFTELCSYMRLKQRSYNYKEINTPEVIDKALWEASGHWEKFSQNMFTATIEDEEKTFAIKPMSCPGAVQVYKDTLRSYRDLPLRLAEFGKVHRYEPSGALHGLMRVRAFTQDDAHIFCTPDQLMEECIKVCKQVLEIYKDFGFHDITIKLSDRPDKRIGSDEIWDKAEEALKIATTQAGLTWSLNAGEGAFYGPKLEFVLKDALGRDWQIGTLQVDFNLPNRLGAYYIGIDGQKHQAIMLHQAIFGSIERFIGILLEHHAGKLPLWLAPVQVVVATISNKVDNYAYELFTELQKANIRCELDIDNEKINYKIRKNFLTKVPIILVIGEAEMLSKTVSVRKLGSETQETLDKFAFISKFIEESKI